MDRLWRPLRVAGVLGVQCLAILSVAGCQNPEEATRDRYLQQNARGAYILRRAGDHSYALPAAEWQPRPGYPWDSPQ